eukprot:4289311-Pyramimonas_sp.AAC.1
MNPRSVTALLVAWSLHLFSLRSGSRGVAFAEIYLPSMISTSGRSRPEHKLHETSPVRDPRRESLDIRSSV